MTKTVQSEGVTILEIFNLQFPPYIDQFKLGDYRFSRTANYKEAFDGMMHVGDSIGSEFNTKVQTGHHQITAIVELPKKEQQCVLPWRDKKLTQLDDVLLLLTLFTRRNVFKNHWGDKEGTAIMEDHRMHYGGQLRLSLTYEARFKHPETGELKTEEEMRGAAPACAYKQVDIGFEKDLNKVLETITSKEWQAEYESGYFLFLFRSAIQVQIIESSFIACWTIWEHIFAIKNRKWLDDDAIRQMSGDKKIAFILSHYFLKKFDSTARNNIQRINGTRNRLVHFGKKTEQVDFEEMRMFMRLTEHLMAIVLGLSPSNAFRSFEELETYWSKQKKEKLSD